MDASADVTGDIERVFRRESARLISVLTRILGPQNLELAEDVVQESFAAALVDWSERGIPRNPAAWLLSAARNRAIDAIRRERTRRRFAPDLAVYLDSEWTLQRTVDEAFDDAWAQDDQLRMIFMCCQADLTPGNRLPLILKTLCGLSVPQVARALLTNESTINKRLYRTRRALEGSSFGLPDSEALPEALETVHAALYLLFNEGYFSSSGEPIVRELCRDAMHLTKLLVDAPAVSNSSTLALYALMCFAEARADSRLDASGRLIPLDEQDRSSWDRAMIGAGYRYLARSTQMDRARADRYHLEAAIAARHCTAPTFADTDWSSICNLYDRLVEIDGSPLTRLNRAVAVAYRSGPEAAIPMVEALRDARDAPSEHLTNATLAHLYGRAGHAAKARGLLAAALAQAGTEHERRLIERQVTRFVEPPGAPSG